MIDNLAAILVELDEAEQGVCAARFASMEEWMRAQSRFLAAKLAKEDAEIAVAWSEKAC